LQNEAELLNAHALQHNARAQSHCRNFSGIVAGCVAGLLKCESHSGVLVFVILNIIHSFMISLKMGFLHQEALPSSARRLFGAVCNWSYVFHSLLDAGI